MTIRRNRNMKTPWSGNEIERQGNRRQRACRRAVPSGRLSRLAIWVSDGIRSPNNEKCVVLTGAGISADSGLLTFRDAGGLWEGHRVTDVCTPEALARNPKLVIDFTTSAGFRQMPPSRTPRIWRWSSWRNITMCTSSRRMWTRCTRRQAAAKYCTCTAS